MASSIKKFDVVAVYWRDAASYHGWRDLDGEFSLLPGVTVGLLIRKMKDAVVIARTIMENDDVGGVQIIPLAWVKRIKKLGVKCGATY